MGGATLSLLFLISTVFVLVKASDDNCPAICDQSRVYNFCFSTLTQDDCGDGEYLVPRTGVCNCCPTCVRGLKGLHEECIHSHCAIGLKCDASTKKCQLDRSTCAYTYHLQGFKSLPKCEPDGNFAAVQCKGDRLSGRCFCYSEGGTRIFGWAWWRASRDMTCACSRLKYNLIQRGFIENTLHCDAKGNFEELQCSDGICWCADPKTGLVMNGTRLLPETLWQFLPCYDYKKVGSMYLRQCESAAYAQSMLRKAYAAHGTTDVEFNNIQCDYDGAYGRYSIANGIATCLWRDGTRLGSFQVQSNKVAWMNCFCARDQKIFAEAGLKHRLSCSGNGNYESIQDINGKVFCVDTDGFAVSEAREMETLPQCSEYLYYEAKPPK